MSKDSGADSEDDLHCLCKGALTTDWWSALAMELLHLSFHSGLWKMSLLRKSQTKEEQVLSHSSINYENKERRMNCTLRVSDLPVIRCTLWYFSSDQRQNRVSVYAYQCSHLTNLMVRTIILQTFININVNILYTIGCWQPCSLLLVPYQVPGLFLFFPFLFLLIVEIYLCVYIYISQATVFIDE